MRTSQGYLSSRPSSRHDRLLKALSPWSNRAKVVYTNSLLLWYVPCLQVFVCDCPRSLLASRTAWIVTNQYQYSCLSPEVFEGSSGFTSTGYLSSSTSESSHPNPNSCCASIPSAAPHFGALFELEFLSPYREPENSHNPLSLCSLQQFHGYTHCPLFSCDIWTFYHCVHFLQFSESLPYHTFH